MLRKIKLQVSKNDTVSVEDKKLARTLQHRKYMQSYSKSEAGKATYRRYNQTEKCKIVRKRYRSSEKCKIVRKRYHSSEKYKAVKKRYVQSELGRIVIGLCEQEPGRRLSCLIRNHEKTK
jgi:hypothetical protein